jgi:hypothetical protein
MWPEESVNLSNWSSIFSMSTGVTTPAVIPIRILQFMRSPLEQFHEQV